MLTRDLEIAQLSPSDRENEELVAQLGGTGAANRYLRAVDPLQAAARWRGPSFHYYPRNLAGDQLVEDAGALEAVLKKSGSEFFLFPTPPPRAGLTSAQAIADRHEAAVAFLRTHL